MKTWWVVLLSGLVVVGLQGGRSWAQSPTSGGTLRLALSGEPAFFNAHQGPAPGAPAFFISKRLSNSLLTITPPPALKPFAHVPPPDLVGGRRQDTRLMRRAP